MLDLIIIGSGPVGLSAAVEAQKHNLDILVLDKGVLCNSIFHFPTFMRFLATADLLEIGNIPFPSTDSRPTRQQALDYYRKVVHNNNIPVKQHHRVDNVEKFDSYFTITGEKTKSEEKFSFDAKYVVIATGYFDNPNGLGGIPGEEKRTICSYYYDEPHQWYDHDVAVIGAGSSGAEAALELNKHNARVTLFHRYSKPKSSLRYWVGPDLNERLENEEIEGIMPAKVVEITDDGLYYQMEGEEKREFRKFDFIYILTGFLPNIELFKKWGLDIDPNYLFVKMNEHCETNIKDLYIIGSAGQGKGTNSVFIENGRVDGVTAVRDIIRKIR